MAKSLDKKERREEKEEKEEKEKKEENKHLFSPSSRLFSSTFIMLYTTFTSYTSNSFVKSGFYTLQPIWVFGFHSFSN
jgi:hypothetical protein